MGGNIHPFNMIKLTIEEHAEAHRRLWELFGKEEDRIAWRMLSGQISISGAKYEAKRLELNKQGDILTAEFKFLRAHCECPDKFTTSSMGDLGTHCPDCGHST